MAMARSRQRAEWERTALLAAIGANPYRDPKKRKRPFQPWEFNPFCNGPPPEPEREKIKISVECLKGLCKGTPQAR
jgi:hypothetical protein